MSKKVKLIIAIIFLVGIISISSILLLNKYNPRLIHQAREIIPIIKEVKLEVPSLIEAIDKNKNGVYDSLDIINEARKEVERKTKYLSVYYSNGGYPPEGEGVCTDIVWRAFKGINVNLKDLVNKDIKANVSKYPRVEGKPDPNIDFRRVKNLEVFFNKYATLITKELKPGDAENLKEWQPGDIIITYKPYEHIFILSDKRDADGVPYIIHNMYPNAEESNRNIASWTIAGHYRWKY